MSKGNGHAENITPWGFVVTFESTKRVSPDDVVDALEQMVARSEDILAVYVEALGEISVTKTQTAKSPSSQAD